MRRALLIVVVLLAASCQSEGDSRETSPAPPDATGASPKSQSVGRDAFVGEVNAACREYAERDEALDWPEDLDDYVPFLRAWIENSASLDRRLARLDLPPEIAGFDAYVADNGKQTDLLRAALPRLEAAVREDDTADADAVLDGVTDDFNAIVDELDPFATRYGLTDCAGGEE